MSSKPDKDDPIELDVPDGVADADQAVEVMRTWIADGSMMLSLNAEAFENRVADWGRILGEVAHHIARAAQLQGHMSEAEALQVLHAAFDATVRANQPTMSGKVRGRVKH
jgi:hypothetical protein